MEPQQVPPVMPAYNKPETPGIWMNSDNTVSIYHIVLAEDDFYQAAQEVFGAIKDAQQRFPGWPRVFYLDIAGHHEARHGFDEAFVEFQQEFWFATLAPFLTGFELPLTGPLINPNPQRDDLPDELVIQHPGEG